VFRNCKTDENCLREEIKIRLNLESACYRSVQNLLSSCLPTKNVMLIKKKRVVLTDVLHRCYIWYLIIRKEHSLSVPEK
jgi:hypothetical protein